ncbi:MAG: hypothetical protein ACRYGL_13665 [Janthinobacterium lividum]
MATRTQADAGIGGNGRYTHYTCANAEATGTRCSACCDTAARAGCRDPGERDRRQYERRSGRKHHHRFHCVHKTPQQIKARQLFPKHNFLGNRPPTLIVTSTY